VAKCGEWWAMMWVTYENMSRAGGVIANAMPGKDE